MGQGRPPIGREGFRESVAPHLTASRDFSSQASQQLGIITDEIIPIGGLATYLRLPQKTIANPVVDPSPFHPSLASQTANRPLLIHLVG
jgi:hypothetical protein